MKFSLFSLSLVLVLTLSGCAHKIVRVDYTRGVVTPVACDVEVLKFADFSNQDYEVIGKIKLGDTGFSVSCSEETAIKILKSEACSLDGSVVNITSEIFPGMSSCYRCEADIIKMNSGVGESSRLEKSHELVEKSRSFNIEAKKKHNQSLIFAAIIGFVAGLSGL